MATGASRTRLTGCTAATLRHATRTPSRTRTCLLAMAILGAAPALYAKEGPDSVLRLELAVFQGLGGDQITQLRKGVDDLWASHDVTVEWVPVGATECVRIVVDRPIRGTRRDEGWNVASTRVVDTRVTPHVYASVDAAERVLASANPSFSTRSLGSLMLVRVLSRAIAHELAHYLLDTRAHTVRGLLRARFTADEFVSPVQEPFRLEREQLVLARKHPLILARAVGR